MGYQWQRYVISRECVLVVCCEWLFWIWGCGVSVAPLASVAGIGIRLNSQHWKQDLTIYIDRHISKIRISCSCELASSYQRRIKLSAGNDSWEGISLWHNFDNQRTWGWFLHFQTVHQKWVVPELANGLATFLTVHAVDSDVEANKKKKIQVGDGY